MIRKPRFLAAASAVAAGALVATVFTGAPAAADPTPGGKLSGKTIFLDPGHQGGADGHDLSKPVPDGRGGTKPCQTTGATSINGVPEHTINWDIAQLVRTGLEAQGAKVVLSRGDDTGWGGCIDERAAAASAAGADVAVSLHADSTSASADPAKRGFHMIVPTLPLPDTAISQVQATGGRAASDLMRDSFVEAGIAPANYGGVVNGIQTRPDIAAVNLTKVPAVFIEMGNLSNPAEAEALTSREGAAKYALAITDGITSFVTDEAPGSGTPPADGEDAIGLASLGPLVEQLLATDDPSEMLSLLMTEGPDASAEALAALLEVVYAIFGGKLPI